jgi:hypothetical protein
MGRGAWYQSRNRFWERIYTLEVFEPVTADVEKVELGAFGETADVSE